MKKILFICIGLTIVIFIILVRLYSDSVVSFVTTGELKDSAAVANTSDTVAQMSATLEEGDEDLLVDKFDEYEEEYLDTVITGTDTLITHINPTYVDGIVMGNQKIKANTPIKFKLSENIEVKEKFLPANTLFYAMPAIAGKEIGLSVNTFQTTKGIVILSLKASKEDLNDVVAENASMGEMMLSDGDTVLFDY